MAAQQGAYGVIEGLIMNKADMNVVDKDRCTPLQLAIRNDNDSAAMCLIESGADINAGGGMQGSAVHLAIVKMKLPILKSLVEKGADLNKQD
mmetsp:Transcript_1696/g.2195  ORF Transcript_1696/g.2195 Transcript_1696/m.2195 type:complete len:92 (+) Transcript_1696:816-1091(+)|eukprot:CAMPEP_0170488362 /NCGR_PEP_ID=MMETSP0208-20121228/6935_1 /TAXON_ID=197538 /ORGANISM="Strombidium inclinatum, Strain S3" /LENGTH=91 /DNA_ID=CAMNT_0010762909 /DNA_START=754 /DNA_END=1029 /DNA_ORIENTATION=+